MIKTKREMKIRRGTAVKREKRKKFVKFESIGSNGMDITPGTMSEHCKITKLS